MIFNQYLFTFAFLPIVLILFYLRPLRQWRIGLLIVASFVFYGYAGLAHLGVLIFDIVAVYVLTRRDEQISRWTLGVAIAIPLLSLIYFKYAEFLIADVFMISRSERSTEFSLFEQIVLPAGISFFTFQTISYAIDRYRGEITTPKFGDFVLYVSFFPQLVAGPIVRFNEVGAQIRGLTEFSPNGAVWLRGLNYFVAGLAFKVLVADSLGSFVNGLSTQLDNLSSLDALFVVFGYSFQIYFDFYGYSLIAIGIASWFGIVLPTNFLRPYEADSPSAFWRKWHVSLSFWIRDYLYLPLGGNKNYLRNITIVFLAVGLWHGAGWNFIAWGGYHALLVIMVRNGERYWNLMPILMRRGANFVLVSFGWLLFIFDFDEIWRFLGRLAEFRAESVLLGGFPWLILAISAVFCFGINVEKFGERLPRFRHQELLGVAYGAILFLCVIFFDYSTSFIYFRF